MSRILLIGNSGTISHGTDGQTVKVRLYLKKIEDEGFAVDFVDLENFTEKPLRTLILIKRKFKKCSRIVLITAERGSKLLVPFINHINHRLKKPFVFPLIGISVLHNSIDRLSEEDKIDFFVNGNYSLCKPKKSLVKQLSKITHILPETELLTKTFINYFGLNNVYQLNNFRENKPIEPHNINNDELRLIYLSRVMAIKGIFDLLDVIMQVNNNGLKVHLDIYGNKCFSNEESALFDSYLNDDFIKYKGVLSNDVVCETISKYDLFVFPTKYHGEGTPGVIVESLIAGTPIITSDFPQAKFLLKDGFDSVFYKMADKNELKNTIIKFVKNKNAIAEMSKNAFASGQKYSYSHERSAFLKYICGVEEK